MTYDLHSSANRSDGTRHPYHMLSTGVGRSGRHNSFHLNIRDVSSTSALVVHINGSAVMHRIGVTATEIWLEVVPYEQVP